MRIPNTIDKASLEPETLLLSRMGDDDLGRAVPDASDFAAVNSDVLRSTTDDRRIHDHCRKVWRLT